jgi:hypothetical protein
MRVMRSDQTSVRSARRTRQSLRQCLLDVVDSAPAPMENADSRVKVGIHFRTACTTGVRHGRQIGRFVINHNLRKL